MTALTKIFLRLKHWQLFIILTLLSIFPGHLMIGRVAFTLLYLIWLLWAYSIGMMLQDKLPQGSKMNIASFRFSVFYAIIFMTVVTLFLDEGYSTNKMEGPLLWIMVPLHFIALWSLLYSFYFPAKTLMSVREQKIVGFDKCFGYFFAIFFVPIGIWFVQPKIQQLYTEEWEKES